MAAVDCQAYPLSCDKSGMCVLAFAYDDAVEIYLARDVPALQHQRHLVLAQATLASIDTTVEAADAGSLPVQAASLYVAPLGATSTRSRRRGVLGRHPIDSREPITWISLRPRGMRFQPFSSTSTRRLF